MRKININKMIGKMIGIMLGVIISWALIFSYDIYRVNNLELPVFVLKDTSAASKEYSVYYGLGYNIKVKQTMVKDKFSIYSTQMFFNNNIIASAIADANTSIFD